MIGKVDMDSLAPAFIYVDDIFLCWSQQQSH